MIYTDLLEILKKYPGAPYRRKSTEPDDRQAASLEDQFDALVRIIKQLGLNVDIENNLFSASKSAKIPNKRVQFKAMLNDIYTGKYRYIVTWQLNRLARNTLEAGQIINLMDENKLIAIVTPSKIYTVEDKFNMYIDFAVSDKSSDDLSKNVYRGMECRAKKGWLPGQPKAGYLNIKSGEDSVMQTNDPERFPKIRAAIDRYLTGHYSVPDILEYLNNFLGYKSKLKKKTGGVPMSLSKLYELLRDPYYYGVLKWHNIETTVHPDVPRLIAEYEYWKIQELLGKKGVKRPKKYFDLPYRGLIMCPTCGGSVIPYPKNKKLSNGSFGTYYYLRCTKNKARVKCTESQITFKEFEKQVKEILDAITISEQFYSWATRWIKKTNDLEKDSQENVIRQLEQELYKTKDVAYNLVDLRIANELTSEEFAAKKQEIHVRQNKLQHSLEQLHSNRNTWLEKAESYLNFARNAKREFENGTFEVKATIVKGLGVNLVLHDKNIDVELLEPYFQFKSSKNSIYQKPSELELTNALVVQDKTLISNHAIQTWWTVPESNR